MSLDPLETPLALPSLHEQFLTAVEIQHKVNVVLGPTPAVGDQIMDLVSVGFEDTTPDRMTPTKGHVTVPISRLESLGVQIHEERKLAQFLGVALREIVPWAGNEIGNLICSEVTEEDRAEVNEASLAMVRAEAALAALSQTPFFIANTPANAFDDEFQIKFEED